MTVSELIETLKEFPHGTECFIGFDHGDLGNVTNPVSDIRLAYVPWVGDKRVIIADENYRFRTDE